MAFQRSYSKVWWGSDNQLASQTTAAGGMGFALNSYYFTSNSQPSTHQKSQPQSLPTSQYHSQTQQQSQSTFSRNASGYHSLESAHFKGYAGNLSRIQEVDDEHNISKLSWEKRDSPGSLRSQDSGFSDNDESHSTRSSSIRGGAASSPGSKSQRSGQSFGSPSSTASTTSHTAATPPTVVRRVGKSEFYSPLVSVSRRISFTGSPSTAAASGKEEDVQLVQSEAGGGERRRKRVTRKPTRPLQTPTKRRNFVDNNYADNEDNDEDVEDEGDSVAGSDDDNGGGDNEANAVNNAGAVTPEYNNETVYLGGSGIVTPPPPYNNETVLLGGPVDDTLQEEDHDDTLKFGENLLSPIRRRHQFTASTSTPKHCSSNNNKKTLPLPEFCKNPLLAGHPPALQSWLGSLRYSCEPEVMSTLQTKSIVQEAFKNLTITTNTVAKLIRQLQQRALYLQSDFERMSRSLKGDEPRSLHEALVGAGQLVENCEEFTKVLERRSVFFTDCRTERRKYDEYLEQIRIMTKDLRYSLERHHYINAESLADDVQVLRRYVLITVRLVFERMVRVIVQAIEQGRSDLMLRANINMVATLMNIEYEGFASLADAFVQNEAVRALLIVCMENRSSSVRALALRALATICSSAEAIAQLGARGGVEILRDILLVQEGEVRGDVERREAVSLLTQLTAVWHGAQHRVAGLKDCVESIVEGITQLIASSECGQTLLLCCAALNNLSRMEITSHYSIMSNEAIFKLIEVVACRPECVSIFLYEQMAAMLHNMSLNKKCHSHLVNGTIINFITSTYETEFYKNYDSRAENDAQRRTVKAILHTLTQLVQHSCLGIEIIKQYRIPAFFEINSSAASARSAASMAAMTSGGQTQSYGDAGSGGSGGHSNATMPSTAAMLKLNPAKQESYV